MKRIALLAIAVLLAMTLMNCATSGLPDFAAEMGKQSSPIGDIRVPYTDTYNYFGYVKPGSTPDAAGDTTNFFDTWISLERANSVVNPSDIASKGKYSAWTSYGSNDNSSELPENPAGRKYNSVLRVVSEPSNPAKALVRGLYRIAFTTYKTGEVQGSFIAQIGTPAAIPGVRIAASLDELAKTAE